MKTHRTHNLISLLLAVFMIFNVIAPTPALAADDESNAVIRSLSATLFYGADKQDDGTFVWNVPTNYNGYQAGHHFNYRISYSTSGEGMLDMGAVKFKIPANIIYNRDGKASNTLEWSIPNREDVMQATDENGNIDNAQIDDNVNFAYYPDGDYFVIYNFRQISAATNGYIDVGYATAESSFAYKDMQEMKFTCDLQVGKDDDAAKQTKTADPVISKINTTAAITATYKQYPSEGRIKEWNDNWGDAVKPADPSAYYYQVYNIKSVISATQPYHFSITDTVSGNYDGVSVLGYHFYGQSGYTANNSVSDQTLTGDRWDSVLVAIPLSSYSDKTTWEINDEETATVTPVDKIDPTTTKTAKQHWNWSVPVFEIPTGHFDARKYGDRTGWSNYQEYSRYDLEDFDGYSAAGEQVEPKLSQYDGFNYRSYVDGYPYPWTADASKATDSEPWKAYGYKPVKFELTDQDFFLVNAETGLLSTNESEYRTIQNKKLDWKKATKLSYSDFSIESLDYSLTAADADYDSVEKGEWVRRSASWTDNDIVVFQGAFDGSNKWVQFATYNPKTGAVTFDKTYVSSMDNNSIVFNANVNLTAYHVTAANSHYYYRIDTYPSIILKNTDTVMDLLKDSDTKGRELAIVNNLQGRFYSLKDGIAYENADYKTLMANDSNWDTLLTVERSATDYARASAKYSNISKSVESTSNNAKKKEFVIGWNIHAENTMEADANGTRKYIPQKSGTFFDLLPKGTILDKSTIQVKAGNTLLSDGDYTVNVISNFSRTGRTMLVVNIDKSGDYYDLRFDTKYPWNSIKDYGGDVYNPVAYKTGNSSITNGTADDGGKIKEARLMSDLSKKCGLTAVSETGNKFIYAENSYDVSALTSAVSGLTKKVKAEEDNKYSKETMTHIGGNYSYELRFMNSYMSNSRNIILFDSLENFDVDTNTNDGKNSAWRGTLQSVDTKQLEQRGASPVIYISTQEHLNLNEHHDLTDKTIWTKVDSSTDLSSAKAVAIDIRKSTDGSDFDLSKGDSIAAYLYMKAPAMSPDAKNGEKYPYTYNNVYVSDTVYDPENKDDKGQDFYIYYNYTKIGLAVTGNVGLEKTNEETGEPIKGIKFRLKGTSAYQNNVDVTKQTDRNGRIEFSDIEMGSYILQEVDATADYLLDPTEHSVAIDHQGKTTIDGVDYTGSAIELTNKPRIHADIKFIKADAVYNTTYIAGAKYRLSGQSAYGDNVLVISESSAGGEYGDGKGLVTFNNIPKSTQNGYQLQEIAAPDGYVLDPTVYKVTIDENGNYRIDGNGIEKYSYTENLKEDGTQVGVYGSNWNNSNIRGTGRTTADSKAHVVTIDGAQKLHVKLTWGGESAEYDWVSVWQGNHPDYTALGNDSSGIQFNTSGEYPTHGGGGNYTDASNTVEFDVNGDSVTFAYTSDPSYCGDGYGYYAVITGEGKTKVGTTIEANKNSDNTYYLTDEPLHYITFTKNSNYDGSALQGAKFEIKGIGDDGTSIDKTAVSEDLTGTVRIDGLPSGTYIVHEKKAPEGYEKDDTKHVVKIEKDGSYTISGLVKDEKSGIYDYPNVKKQDKTIAVTKVWDDGETSDNPGGYIHTKSENGTVEQDPSKLAITLTTTVPQQSQRTYNIKFDANGGTFGNSDKDTNGNILTYNAKNSITSGTYYEPSSKDEENYYFVGWSITKGATNADPSITLSPNDLTNTWLNNRKADSVTTLYAVYGKRQSVYYAVSPYGIGVDQVEAGEIAGITFGPATGNMLSNKYTNGEPINNIYDKYAPHVNAHKISDSTYLINDNNVTTSTTTDGSATDGNGNYVAVGTSAQRGSTTVTKAMMQADMDAVQDESASALTDNGSNAIVGDDAGTDEEGNTYRCIHYDNWNTILYWNNKDPHVYDKCVKNHCSKQLEIKTVDSSTSNTDEFNFQNKTTKDKVVGDGKTYIAFAIWDNSDNPGDYNSNKSDYMYKKSEIRAKLIGSDSDMRRTKISNGSTVEKDNLAFYDSLSEDRKSYLAAFPSQLRSQMAHKVLYDTEHSYKIGMTSYADKLWLLDSNEAYNSSNSAGSASYTDRNAYSFRSRGNDSEFWLRSRFNNNSAHSVGGYGYSGFNTVYCNRAVSPCFVLKRS